MLKLSNKGDELLWCTYYGGSDVDEISSIAVNNEDKVVIAGSTKDGISMYNGIQMTYGGGSLDGFVAKFQGNGLLEWSSYLGGSSEDKCMSITHSLEGGPVNITGKTNSINDYPVTGNAFRSTRRGTYDAFLTMLTSNGDSLIYSTYFGGDRVTSGTSIVYDNDGCIIAGNTNSRFDLAYNGFDMNYHGGIGSTNDGFIAKLKTDGTLTWSSYIGGETDDYLNAICELNDSLYICGYTDSYTNIYTLGAFSDRTPTLYDAFVMKIARDGSSKIWGTYFGNGIIRPQYPDTRFIANAICLSKDENNPIIAGKTDNASMSIGSYPYQGSNNGSFDGFIARIKYDGSWLRREFEDDKILIKRTIIDAEGISIKVYPNPAYDILNLEFSIKETSNVRICLYNFLGQRIFESSDIANGDFTKSEEIHFLPAGVYMIHIAVNDKIYSRSIIIE